MEQINIKASIKKKVTAAKFDSKREIFEVLTLVLKAYLSPYNTITIHFLKGICSGKRKCKKTYNKPPIF